MSTVMIGEALSGYKLIQVNVRIKMWSGAICSFVHYIMCTDVVISEWFIEVTILCTFNWLMFHHRKKGAFESCLFTVKFMQEDSVTCDLLNVFCHSFSQK